MPPHSLDATSGLTSVDWIVIASYGVGMVLVGWYYSRRTKTAEDYLLGGRNMRPWAVGLSMFATLLSTISYLSYPGEVIPYGPMILTQIAAYPLIFWVIGWFLIPRIMKLKVTTAYEILDARFGASIHMLGSLIFLTLRLLWMATIIYVTTSKVLIPLLGWEQDRAPLLCAVLGVVTIIYTSLGGLRAVVVTDVVQTAILLGAAILTLVLITRYFGGVGAWWPDQWYEHWPEPVWGFDPSARISFGGMFLSGFTWYVCTSGSDQMAIQRYLATRDVKSARWVLLVSLTTDIVLASFLGLLGLALLAYFLKNPQLVPAGLSLFEGKDADKIFPHFVMTALPSGITGLVVAGLLAAAMSSLSSGVNSSSSVITVDLIGRFRRKPLAGAAHVRIARWSSVAVGAAVVGLSLYGSLVPGNIVELCYRVVNLLVTPLFLLFFMALFVPWATPFGTWVGALTGMAVALAIGFSEELFRYLEIFPGSDGISFLWIMPYSFLAGALAGLLASLLPVGPPAKSMLVDAKTADAD